MINTKDIKILFEFKFVTYEELMRLTLMYNTVYLNYFRYIYKFERKFVFMNIIDYLYQYKQDKVTILTLKDKLMKNDILKEYKNFELLYKNFELLYKKKDNFQELSISD